MSLTNIAPDPTVAELPEQLYSSPSQLARLFNVSRRTIWMWVASGRLPQPLRLSRNIVRWERATLIEFIRELKETRSA